MLRQRYGAENVFDLSLGNPVMEPPVEFERELRRLAKELKHTLPEAIRARREALGLTPFALSELVGKRRSSEVVRYAEEGRSRLKTRLRIVAALEAEEKRRKAGGQ